MIFDEYMYGVEYNFLLYMISPCSRICALIVALIQEAGKYVDCDAMGRIFED